MDPESKQLLLNTFSLAEENNKMLKSIRRTQRWAHFARVIYWLILLGFAVGAYHFVSPYVDQFKGFTQDAGQTFNNFKNLLPQ